MLDSVIFFEQKHGIRKVHSFDFVCRLIATIQLLLSSKVAFSHDSTYFIILTLCGVLRIKKKKKSEKVLRGTHTIREMDV